MDKNALILVVDDNSECRRLLEWILELHGFRTISAACGLDAVKLAIDSQPSLVLMDIGLPGLDGWQASRMLKADPATAAIPVVVLTAEAGPDVRERALAAGADAYLTKPFDPNEMIRVVRELASATPLAPPSSP